MFVNNDPLNALMVLARDEQFIFPLKMIQRGDHWMIFQKDKGQVKSQLELSLAQLSPSLLLLVS